MRNLVTPIFSLASVVVGGLIAVLSALFADKRRWEREDQTRWYDARRAAYAQLLSAAWLVQYYAISRERPWSQAQIDQMAMELRRMREALGDVDLLSVTTAVRDAARNVDQAVTKVINADVKVKDSGGSEEARQGLRAATQQAIEAQVRFRRVARSELGLPPEKPD